MAKIIDKSKRVAELQLTLRAPGPPLHAAQLHLKETPHRPGCQCHRCHWAHGVISGRIKIDFDSWRNR